MAVISDLKRSSRAGLPCSLPHCVPVILTCAKTGHAFRRFVHSYQERVAIPPLVMLDVSAGGTMMPEYLEALLALAPRAVQTHARELGSVYESVQLAAFAALRWAWEVSGKKTPVLFLEDDLVFASDFQEALERELADLGPKDGMVTLYQPAAGYGGREVKGFYGTQAVLFHPEAIRLLVQNQAKAMEIPPGYDLQWSRYLQKRGWKVLAADRSYCQHQQAESRLASMKHTSQLFYQPDPSEIDRLRTAEYFQWMLEERPDYQKLAAVLWEEFQPGSMLDVGCGNGFLLEWMHGKGVAIAGVEGSLHGRDAVPAGMRERVVLHDLRSPYFFEGAGNRLEARDETPGQDGRAPFSAPCGAVRQADLVVCTEVAQELPEACLDTLLDSLVRATGGVCFFSAPPPGQSGDALNAQPREYWIARANDAGFTLDESATERVRGKLKEVLVASWWLAENAMVFRKATTTPEPEADPFLPGIPLFCYINLDARQERRVLVENELRRMGVPRSRMRRIPGVRHSAHGGVGCTLSHIAALELALQENQEYLCVVEDDFLWVQNREEIQMRWQKAVEHQHRWDVLMLTGAVEDCYWVEGPWYRAVQLRNSVGYIIQRKYIPALLANLRQSAALLEAKPEMYYRYALDQWWKSLQKRHQWWIMEPRLASTREDVSSIDHRQKSDSHVMTQNLSAMAKPGRSRSKSWNRPLPVLKPRERVAVLFLTRGDLNHPGLWQEWLEQAPDRVGVYAHAKSPHKIKTKWLKEAVIPDKVDTSYASPSIVAAELALLRAAVQEEQNRFFILVSEACVPVKPLGALLEILKSDGRSRLVLHRPEELPKNNPAKASRFASLPAVPESKVRFHQQWWCLNREAALLAVAHPMLDLFPGVKALDESWPATPLALLGYPWQERAVGLDVMWNQWRPTPAEPLPKSPALFDQVPRSVISELHAGPWFFARKFAATSDIGSYKLHIPK